MIAATILFKNGREVVLKCTEIRAISDRNGNLISYERSAPPEETQVLYIDLSSIACILTDKLDDDRGDWSGKANDVEGKEARMSMHSTDGREWAKLSALKEGDKLLADGGFTCIEEGAILTVAKDGRSNLFVPCGLAGKDKHYLDGQISDDDHDHLVGFWPAPATDNPGA